MKYADACLSPAWPFVVFPTVTGLFRFAVGDSGNEVIGAATEMTPHKKRNFMSVLTMTKDLGEKTNCYLGIVNIFTTNIAGLICGTESNIDAAKIAEECT